MTTPLGSPVIRATSGADECPFPGLHSYDLDRQDSFKGREQETIELAQRILASRLTVLTAGSGDGKTSLIHAGVVPLLLAEGYEVAVAEPGGRDPLLATARAALDRLLPVGASNIVMLDWLDRNIPGNTLREKREHLLKERRSGIRKTPWPVDRPLDQFQGGPIWTWLISEACSDAAIEHGVQAVSRDASQRAVALAWPGLDAPLKEVREYFRAAASTLRRPWMDLAGKPMEALDVVLAELARAIELRSTAPGFALVLFIDQLEEIFVQFRGGPMSRDGTQPWRQRQALLELICEIKEAGEWPIRMVLSLRKEHYADLQAAFSDQEFLASNTYHLAPLRREQALVTLDQLRPLANDGALPVDAAEKPDVSWHNFLEQAVTALASEREGKWVDATELSSFGRWLWNKPVPDNAAEAVGGALLSQVRALLNTDARNHVITSPARRQEALETLSRLIVASEGGEGRRISLPEQSLRAPPSRSAELRDEILSYLTRVKLVRVEPKDGHRYYAIVHERIIAVLDDLTREWHEPLLADLSRVLEALRERCLSTPLSPPSLSPYDISVLAANLERIEVSDFFASRLLDGLLAQRVWEGDRECGDSKPLLRLLTYLRKQAAKDARGITADNAAQRIDRAMRQGELASPALASRYRAGRDDRAAAGRLRWLIASSLVRAEPAAEELQEWAASIRRKDGCV